MSKLAGKMLAVSINIVSKICRTGTQMFHNLIGIAIDRSTLMDIFTCTVVLPTSSFVKENLAIKDFDLTANYRKLHKD